MFKPRCWDEEAIARAKKLRRAYDSGSESIKTDIEKEIARYSIYHNIEIMPGLKPPGFSGIELYTNAIFEVSNQIDLQGKRVLDIGCRDGAVALEAERKGASEVYALDNDFSAYLANFLIPFKNSSIKCVEANLNDLQSLKLGEFDIVFICGVLYHLPSPFWGLRQARNALRPGGHLIVETAMIDAFEDFPVVAYFSDEKSPYDKGSPTFFNLAGLNEATSLLELEGQGNPVRWGNHLVKTEKHFPKFAKASGISKLEVYRYTALYQKQKLEKNFYTDYWDALHVLHTRENWKRDPAMKETLEAFDKQFAAKR